MASETQLLRRVGVIGDVHTEDQALEAALRFLQGFGNLDAIFCTGDVVTGLGDAGRCCALLAGAGVLTVRGNHDRWFFAAGYEQMLQTTPSDEITGDDRTFLASLPPTRSFLTPRGPLLLCHGLGADDMAGVYPHDHGYALDANHRLHALVGGSEYRFIINGHTHQRMVRTFDHLTIINAGTLRGDKQPCFLTADFEAGTVRYYDVSADDLTITEADTFSLPARG